MSLLDKALAEETHPPPEEARELGECTDLALAWLSYRVGSSAAAKALGFKTPGQVPGWIAQTLREALRANRVRFTTHKPTP